MLMRLLLLTLAGVLLWRWWQRRVLPATAPDNTPLATVACDVCGLVIPAREAIRQGRLHFCSNLHRDQHLAKPRP